MICRLHMSNVHENKMYLVFRCWSSPQNISVYMQTFPDQGDFWFLSFWIRSANLCHLHVYVNINMYAVCMFTICRHLSSELTVL